MVYSRSAPLHVLLGVTPDGSVTVGLHAFGTKSRLRQQHRVSLAPLASVGL